MLTEHTVHIAVLPDASHLADQDRSPLKLKTYQLGPTTHVIPQSPVVSALWHPLANSSYATECLVTVTAESAVRVWELDRANHWSFDRPALAVDLKKLVDGTSCDQDFAPSTFGKNRGFSADVFDMEATSACFGGSGLAEEDGWAAMTLWVAMRNGDIYALCPLLPSKWRPSPTTVPALSISVVSKTSSIDTEEIDPDEEGALRQQFQWVQEIDDAPTMTDSADGNVPSEEVLLRPSNPSAIPRLQGPFEVELGNGDEDLEVSDIHVMAAKLDFEELLSSEEVEFSEVAEAAEDSLAATIICLATVEGLMHVLLDTEGVSGQWLPKTESGTFAVPTSDAKELVLVDSIEFDNSEGQSAGGEWPTITSSVTSRYDIYVVSSQHITFMSFADWASRLDAEISSIESGEAGLSLRLRNVCEGPFVLKEQVLTINEGASQNSPVPLSGPVLIHDLELGHMLLTSSASHPYAVSFDHAQALSPVNAPVRSPTMSLTPIPQNIERIRASTPLAIEAATPRDSYEPHSVFYHQPTAPLKNLLTANIPQRQKMTLKQEIRLSPATLDVMGSAHRTLATQTTRIENAASDLFRRCERLREELSNQVKQMSELSSRTQRLGHDVEDDEEVGRNFAKRLEKARDRQRILSERHEALRRKIARAGTAGRDLSAKEMSWAQEIRQLANNVGVSDEDDEEERLPVGGKILDDRFDTVSSQGHHRFMFMTLNQYTRSSNLQPSCCNKPRVCRTSHLTQTLLQNPMVMRGLPLLPRRGLRLRMRMFLSPRSYRKQRSQKR